MVRSRHFNKRKRFIRHRIEHNDTKYRWSKSQLKSHRNLYSKNIINMLTSNEYVVVWWFVCSNCYIFFSDLHNPIFQPRKSDSRNCHIATMKWHKETTMQTIERETIVAICPNSLAHICELRYWYIYCCVNLCIFFLLRLLVYKWGEETSSTCITFDGIMWQTVNNLTKKKLYDISAEPSEREPYWAYWQ